MPSKTPPVPLETIRRSDKNKLRIFSRGLPFRSHAGGGPLVKIFGGESLAVWALQATPPPGLADAPLRKRRLQLLPQWRTTRAKAGATSHAGKGWSLRLRTDKTKQCYPDPQWPFTHPENCWKNFGIPPPGEKFGIDLLP